MKNFKDLFVWQKGIDLVELVYKRTEHYPPQEQFGLTNQQRRAAVSIASDIAEGHMRSTAKDFRHFLRMALGSAAELETQTIIAGRLGYPTTEQRDELIEKIEEVTKMTASLAAKLKS